MDPLPTVIKVGPYVYTMSADESAVRRYEHKKLAAHAGYTDHGAMAMYMDPTLPPCHQRETLWHEVKHMVANLSGHQGKLDEEDWISRTSPMELAVLRENPAVVAFLLAPD